VAGAFTDRFTNHVGYESVRTSEFGASSWIACRPDLLDERGNLHEAVVGYLVDSTAGVVCGTAAVPDWVVTADLQFRVVCADTVGPLRADAVAVRPGRRQSLGEVRVVDEGAGERLVAVGTVNHIVIPKADDLDVPADMPIGVRYGPANPLVHIPARLEEHFGLRCDPGSGIAELDVVGDAVNPLGILHGGLLSLLASAAARSLFDGDSVRLTDMVLRFVGSLPCDRVARAVAEVVDGSLDAPVVRITIADPDDERGRIGTLISAGFARS
jgi:acyl-coenzyme A thioesterase PaaI-like protein